MHRNSTYVASGLLLVTVHAVSASGFTLNAQDIGVQVPEGFHVSQYADDDLAHDIHSMTVDSLGRIVVSGPGYVRILIDGDGDNKADSFKQFADGPRTGAQGMYFLERDLLCTGDAGLIRYRDRNADDQADGPPDVFWRFKTGSEHNIHALRKGPDGWWYLIAGNMAGISNAYVTLPTSPVKHPNAGTFIRFTPNLSTAEVLADGFRNSYDFDFNAQGDVFAFDSDGEREVSLPWYCPTRVFHVLPGGSHGWFSRSWKRPDYFPDMPPVVASFGRGSPTGVVTYRHTMFPKEYRNALFVLDWTFGRVFAVRLTRAGSTWHGEPTTFMTGVGQFGFAPTDVVVGSDGSLYVCVGGRGTRGGVFRISYGETPSPQETPKPTSTDEMLHACLEAPQPYSSWSRHRWMPLAEQLGREAFLAAALDEQGPQEYRVRAIEVLTELFGSVDAAELKRFLAAQAPDVRARAVWSHARTRSFKPDTALLARFLNDDDSHVVRWTLETFVERPPETDFVSLIPGLAKQLEGSDRFIRQTAARVFPKLSDEDCATLTQAAGKMGNQAVVSAKLGALERTPGFDRDALDVGLRILSSEQPASLKLEAVRLMQIALGDVGPLDKRPPVFDGYASPLDLSTHERDLDHVRIGLADTYPTGQHDLDVEIGRLMAMLTPYNSSLLDRVLSKINDESDPVEDIHQLIVAARIPVRRTSAQQAKIAYALVKLDAKIVARGLKRDANWVPRILELNERLTELDPDLPARLLSEPGFGRPGHVVYLGQLPESYLQEAVAVFAQQIDADPNYPWDNDVVFVLGESDNPAHRELLRKQFDQFSLRNAVLIVLSDNPEEQDREKFVAGLESSQMDVLGACVDALFALPAGDDGEEQVALLRTVRRLGADRQELKLRDQLIALLRRNTGQQFGFEPDAAESSAQTEAVERWAAWMHEKYPQQAASLDGSGGADIETLDSTLVNVDWDTADPARGEAVFRARSCAQCHGGRSALGPDLNGAAERFSRKDLFTAIAAPNRDVSPRYQTSMIETVDGKVYSGLVIFESADGLLLRNGNNQTFRIKANQIESRQVLNSSLMPTGLLQGLSPQDLSDLYSYLRSLSKK